MRFIKYAGIVTLSICAVRAYGDFYPITSIAGSSGISAARPGWEEHLGERGEIHFIPLEVENVAVKSQDLRIAFRSPDTIEVESDYVLTTYGKDVSVEVQYFFYSWYYFFENEMCYVPGFEDFDVSLNGKTIDTDKITYFLIDPEPGYPGDYTVVYPLEFRKARDYKVGISYSQKVPDSFAAVKEAAYKRQNLYGFSYDISPLRYWAGDVEDVRVELVVDGFDVTDFGLISPSDFEFTAEGCKWEWHDLTDEVLSEDYRVTLYFGKAGGLGGDFTEVLREGGMDVYNYPMPDAEVIKTLERGERVYLFRDDSDENLSGPQYERGWRKCRLLDNTEGYVITWLPEYFFDSFERRKMMGSYPTIYGDEYPSGGK